MSAAIKITCIDYTAAELRAVAAKCIDADKTRRLLAIAMLLDGAPRLDAARQTGMDRQTLRDWVHRYNEAGLQRGRATTRPASTAWGRARPLGRLPN
jgi:hypothetical protein